MADVLFYHLEQARLETVLPDLLEKTLANGWNAVVRCGSHETVTHLDEVLWTYRDEAFLPHGIPSGEATDKNHPIILTTDEHAPNEPDLIFLVDGAVCDVTEISAFKRCVQIFDGSNEDAIRQARLFWKAVSTEKHNVTYWKQGLNGKWEKQN